MKKNFKQFKMSNGDELIAEVLAQEQDEVIARHCLRIYAIDMGPQTTYYTFKPWMLLKDDTSDPVSLNAFHIIGITFPEKNMIKQYKVALKRLKQQKDEEVNFEEVSAWLDESNEASLEMNMYEDEEEDNIIPFNKNKLH